MVEAKNNSNVLGNLLHAQKEAMIRDLERLIRIRSVEGTPTEDAPYGEAVRACLDEALAISKELGFEAVNVDNQCGYAEIGSGEEMIAVLGHLDVVPEADGWTHKPYDPEIVDGKMFGRGTIDDKGPVIAGMYAMKAIQDAGIPLKRRVRMIFGCNEETGAADIKYYKAHGGEIPVMGFTPDGEYPLINGEKGIINEVYERTWKQSGDWQVISFGGGVAGNVAPDFAKITLLCPEGYAFADAEKVSVQKEDDQSAAAAGQQVVSICASGVSAHGSMPERGENAIGRLFLYVKELPFEGEVKDTFAFLADHLGMEVNGEGLGCPLEDDVSGKFTCNMGLAEGDADHIWVRLNYRYPVTHQVEDCQPIIQELFAKNGWTSTYSLHKPKLYVEEDALIVRLLLDVYRSATGDQSAPKSIGGGTYAKAMPNTLAFGCVFPGDPIVEHLPDEFIELDRLMQNAEIMASAIVALANA